MKKQLFVPIARMDAAKEGGDPREKFYSAWRDGRMMPSGIILKDSPDQFPTLTINDRSAMLRVPIEIQMPNTENTQTAARGGVILVCDNAEFIAKLNELRKSAATETLADVPQASMPTPIPWRFANISSDMKPLTPPKTQFMDDGGGTRPPG